jgi:hypothetical protein
MPGFPITSRGGALNNAHLLARHAAPKDFILGLDGEQQDRTANG